MEINPKSSRSDVMIYLPVKVSGCLRNHEYHNIGVSDSHSEQWLNSDCTQKKFDRDASIRGVVGHGGYGVTPYFIKP